MLGRRTTMMASMLNVLTFIRATTRCQRSCKLSMLLQKILIQAGSNTP